MASLTLKNVKKIYPFNGDDAKKKKNKGEPEKKTNLQITDKGVVAVQEFNLEIADKEFIVLVGPSGCGKSTTLRMIAGLEEISEGELYIGDRLVNDVAPKDRDIAMVFQNYALYFGTVEKPECDMLYNVTTMCTTWHTVATRDARLLKRQMEQVCALPKTCLFQNYLRCHDDIGWGLDYPWLEQFGITEVAHKKYLNDWFTGKLPGSWSKGELYNDDPRLGDARLCGTTASLTGLEKAAETEDNALMDQSMLCFWMLHAWMFSQSGIPVLYSGDEVAQFNDNDYKADPDKMDDSRYLHRGNFDWEKAALRTDISTVQGKAFSFLRKLETIRAEHPAFRSDAKVTVLDIGCDSVLGISRKYNGEELLLLFNFSEKPVTCNLGEGQVLNLIFGGAEDLSNIDLTGYGFRWLAC